jgi:hypothetical protein
MIAALGCVVLWQAAGCKKPAPASPAIEIRHEIAPWPARVGATTVTVSLSDAGGHAVSGARITLEADMSHPGMRPEFGEAREIAAGRYQGRLTFSMPGDWVILVHITLPAGQTVERQLEVKGVRAN